MRTILIAVVALTLLLCNCLAADRGTLSVRVVDEKTAAPLHARLMLKASDGTYPGDRLSLSAKNYPNLEAHAVYIPGQQSFELPAGQTSVTAARGPEYGVDEQQIVVESGKITQLTLKLPLLIDVRKLGWVCGDAHLHMIHGEMQRPTSYEDVALTCRAMGMDWAGVNQEYVNAGQGDLQSLQANCAKLSDDHFRMFIGGERPKSLLGHNALIGVDNPFIIPDDPPYHRAARDIHAAGGVLFPVHPVRYYPEKQYQGKWLDFPGNNLARELLFDAFCGPSFDGLSVISDNPDNPTEHRLWFNLLNRGLFVPALADSDACFDRPVFGNHAPGFWRTYLHTNGKTDPASLAQAIRDGKTFATTGPLVFFDIDGQLSGSTFPPNSAGHRAHITVSHPHHHWTLSSRSADGASGIAKVELLRNGVVIKTWEPHTIEARLEHEFSEREPSWYAVRVFGFDRKWQVALASPIYFRDSPAATKRPVFASTVRGRIYDFTTGQEQSGQVTIRCGNEVLKQFKGNGQFRVKIPLDATLTVRGDAGQEITHDLLMNYGPVHHFLWNLRSADLGEAKTFDRFEEMVRNVDLEFPLGYRMAGCYTVDQNLPEFGKIKVLEAPPPQPNPAPAVAAILVNATEIAPHDSVDVAAVFFNPPSASFADPRLVVEGRAYDPRHPSGFTPLKLFASVESSWSKAADAGNGYRMIKGRLSLPDWIDPGPVHAIEINVRLRGEGGRDLNYIGLRLALGQTRRQLVLSSPWPTMPLSWPDHNYGIGPLSLCNKNGRESQPRDDSRHLHLQLQTPDGNLDLLPSRDAQGCPDADDAIYTSHFLDQILNAESKLATPEPVREQPKVQWRDLPLIDASRP